MSGAIRRNAEGVPTPTKEQLDEAHAYATDLLRDGRSDRDVSPLQMACALWNMYRGFVKAQSALLAVTGAIAHAWADGIIPEPKGEADEDEDEEAADADPRLN